MKKNKIIPTDNAGNIVAQQIPKSEQIVANISIITPHICIAEAYASEVLGATLYQALEEYPDLLELCRRWVILEAYKRAIPYLDVEITSTGFAIVSNQNFAPASAGRVAKLTLAVSNEITEAYDAVINYIIHNKEANQKWTGFGRMQIENRLYPSQAIAQEYTIREEDFKRLIELRFALSTLIGISIVIELQKEYVSNRLTDNRRKALEIIREYGASYLHGLVNQEIKDTLIDRLETIISDVPEYANSSARRTRKMQRFRNNKDSNVYFAGI